ncbi:MAG: signal peptidase I [Desulfobacteraceae bacterium]
MENQKETAGIKKKSTLREYVEAAAIAVLLALFIRTFVVQAFKIPSGSMRPTLIEGDHILVNKFIYGVKVPYLRNTIIPLKEPKRGDIIVFIFPKDKSKDFIKRVIGLPGEKVEVAGRKVYINGELLNDPYGYYENPGEPWGNPTGKCAFCSVTVPDGHYFVLGDNRENSQDSRYWGFVPFESIKGKAFIIYWSGRNWRRLLDLVS